MNFANNICNLFQSQPINKHVIKDDYRVAYYDTIPDEIRRNVAYLVTLGIEPGDRVLFDAHNSIDWVSMFLACIYLGAIPATLTPGLTTDVSMKMIHLCEPKIILIDQRKQKWSLRDMIMEFEVRDFSTVDQIPCSEIHLDAYDFKNDQECLWLGSSGTSGFPKWVVHGHQSLEFMPAAMGQIYDISNESVVYSTSRLNHVSGLVQNLCAMTQGACCILTKNMPTRKEILRILAVHQITHFFASTNFINNLVQFSDTVSLPNLRYAICSGEILSTIVESKFNKLFGLPLLNRIGMSEIFGSATVHLPHNYRSGSVGKDTLWCVQSEIRKSDENSPSAVNEVGHLWIKSPSVALRYHGGTPDINDNICEGWFRTDDLCYKDHDGYVFYVARGDKNVKINSKFINLADIEHWIGQINGVIECAVSLVIDSNGRSALYAKIRSSGEVLLNESSIRESLLRHLPQDQIPRYINCTSEPILLQSNKKDRYVAYLE